MPNTIFQAPLRFPLLWAWKRHTSCIGVARGAKGAMTSKRFLENIVILCFERRFIGQNSVIRLKSNILPSPLTPILRHLTSYRHKHNSPCRRGKPDAF